MAVAEPLLNLGAVLLTATGEDFSEFRRRVVMNGRRQRAVLSVRRPPAERLKCVEL